MAYKLTPADRLAIYNKKQQQSNRRNYYVQPISTPISMPKTVIKNDLLGQANTIKPTTNQGGSDASVLLRVGATGADALFNTVQSVLNVAERVIDAGASIVGAIGGAFDSDFQDNVKDFISTNYVDLAIGDFVDSFDELSYMGDIGDQIFQGVGEMLPVIAVGVFGGPVAAKALFATSAYGGSVEQAYNEGAGYYQGMLYGGLSASVELLIESISAGIGDKVSGVASGKSFGDALRKLAGNNRNIQLGLQVLGDALGEGAEEVVAEWVDPLLRRVYDENALEDYEKLETMVENSLQSFIVGAGVGGILGGVPVATNVQTYKGRNIQSDINKERRGQLDRAGSNTYTEADNTSYKENMSALIKEQQENLSKMSVERRRRFVLEQQESGNVLFENFDIENNRFDENSIRKSSKSVEYKVAEGINYDKLSDLEKERFNQGKEVVKAFNEIKGGEKITFVGENKSMTITNPDGTTRQANAWYSDGEIHINLNSDVSAKELVIHEMTHSLEGTNQYNILKDIAMTEFKFITLEDGTTVYDKEYSRLEEKYKDVYKGDDLTEAIEKEILANFTSKYFESEANIRKLTEKEPNLAKKLLKWIKEKITSLGKKKTYEGMGQDEAIKQLSKLEKMFTMALEKGGVKSELDTKKQSETSEQETKYSLEETKSDTKVETKEEVKPKTIVERKAEAEKTIKDIIDSKKDGLTKTQQNKLDDFYHRLLSEKTNIDKTLKALNLYIKNNSTISEGINIEDASIITKNVDTLRKILESKKKEMLKKSMELKEIKDHLKRHSSSEKLLEDKQRKIIDIVGKYMEVIDNIQGKYRENFFNNLNKVLSGQDIDGNALLSIRRVFNKHQSLTKDTIKSDIFEINKLKLEIREELKKTATQIELGKKETKTIEQTGVTEFIDETLKNKTIKEKVVETAKTTKDKAVDTFKSRSDIKSDFQRSFTNTFADVEKFGKKYGIKNILSLVNAARSSRYAAQSMLGDYQYDYKGKKVGKGLKAIYAEIDKSGKRQEFNNYMLHLHNIDRMSLTEKGLKDIDKKKKELADRYKKGKITAEQYEAFVEEMNKPVFGKEITRTVSESKVAEIEKNNPEFIKYRDELRKYIDALLQYRADTNLISQEQLDFMRELYPNYVPTFRETHWEENTKSPTGLSKRAVVEKTIKKATGSESNIIDIGKALSHQTMQVVSAGKYNMLIKSLHDATISNEGVTEISIKGREKTTINNFDEEIDITSLEEVSKAGEITYYENGEKITLEVEKGIYEGIRSLIYEKSFLDGTGVGTTMEGAMRLFKKVTTEWSPTFIIRNFLRDFQDALIYTRYGGKTFLKNYARAWKEIKNDGKYFQEFKAAGGFASSIFDYDSGIITKKESGFARANRFIELVPRVAEFISSREAGNSMDKALLDAHDVTVNFGRTGKVTKQLNRYLIPYLNPAVQGFSKTIRTFVQPESFRAWALTVGRAVAFAIVPAVLNELMYGDEEEYEMLNNETKENYYLLKVGKHFVKFPKGRVSSAVGGIVTRSMRAAKGDEDAFEGYMSNAMSQVTPSDNMFRTILSPLVRDVPTNTTWYGGQIESRRLQSLPISARIDSDTSSIATFMSKIVNVLPGIEISPKKMHYLIDQYTGFFGDLILPLTTNNKSLNMLGFTVNSTKSNKLSRDFYSKLEKATYDKNTKDTGHSKAISRYYNHYAGKLSDLYAEQREIEASKELSNKEKKEQSLFIQGLINTMIITALEGAKKFSKTLENFNLDEEYFEDDYREATRITFGAEQALKQYNKKVYEKATSLSKAGIDFDLFYTTYFDALDIEPEYDDFGKAIAGTRRVKVEQYISNLKISAVQKYILLGMVGYKNKNGLDEVMRYLRKQGLTKEEVLEILKISGYDIENLQ